MEHARPLPTHLARRYLGWKATSFAENESWYRHLAQQGQHPRAMMISCCDSRVHTAALFNAEAGEFFTHRNIANLIPPYEPDGGKHGTSAAIEFAVTSLKVAHLMVTGHSACGGAKGCLDMCTGHAPELEEPHSFLGRWLDILRPGYERIKDIPDETARLRAIERQTVIVSLDNLMTFPFIEAAVKDGRLTLHGLWIDIGSGRLEQFEPAQNGFVPI